MLNEVSKEYIGLFWDPNKPRKKVNCELILNSQEIILRTIDSFKVNDIFRNEEFEIIFGRIHEKKSTSNFNVILYKLYRTLWSSSELDIKEYRVETCLLNNSAATPLSTSFKSLRLFSDALDSIIISRNFRFEKLNLNRQFSVSYNRPPDIYLFESKDFNMKICFSFESTVSKGEVNLSEKPFLSLEFNNEKNMDHILKLRHSIERWISAILHRNYKFDLTLLENTNRRFYKVIHNRTTVKKHYPNYDQKKLISKLEKTFKKWLQFENNNKDAVNTFFFVNSDFEIDIYNKFLNYVFSLEKLHRSNFPEKYQLKETDIRFLDEFEKSQIKGDLKSWIRKQLRTEKFVNLSSRLKDLINITQEHLDNYNDLIQNEEIKRIVDTRNYLAHLDDKQKINSFHIEEVIQINNKLEELFFTFININID